MTNYAPILKVVTALVASAITWGIIQVGVDLGSDAINEAAAAIVGIIAAYLIPDPRVTT